MRYPEDKMKRANSNAFLIIGCMESAWAPMVPFVKKSFDLDEGQLGMLLLCTGLGSILALPIAGQMCRRYGAKRTIYVSGMLLALTLGIVASGVNLWLTAAMLILFGMCTVQIDVASNVNGVTLEENFRKSMMSGFHGGYSLGTLLGAGLMSLLLTFGMDILPAALIVLTCTLVYFFSGCRQLLGKDDLDTAPRDASDVDWDNVAAPENVQDRPLGHKHRSGFHIPPIVIVVGLVCFVLYSSEGAVMSWSAVFVNQERGVDMRFAGYFFTAFAVCMTISRFCGNALVTRFGAGRVVVYGAVLVTVGFLAVAIVPSLAVTAIGFVLIGIGEGNIVPQLVSYAGRIRGMAVQNIITVITAIGYSGVLLGPVIIGFCARHFGLPATFVGIAIIIGLVTFVLRYLFSRETGNIGKAGGYPPDNQ